MTATPRELPTAIGRVVFLLARRSYSSDEIWGALDLWKHGVSARTLRDHLRGIRDERPGHLGHAFKVDSDSIAAVIVDFCVADGGVDFARLVIRRLAELFRVVLPEEGGQS